MSEAVELEVRGVVVGLRRWRPDVLGLVMVPEIGDLGRVMVPDIGDPGRTAGQS